jgi:hypothetical protein
MLGDIINHLREGIHERFRVPVTGNTLSLIETATDAICKEILINTEGIQPILINLDQDGLHPLLSTSIPGLQKRSDYLIICPTANILYFLVVEIKSNTPRQWRHQCAAGECLADYILSTLERVHGLEIRKHVKFRHVLFTSSQQAISKRPTGKGTGAFYHMPGNGYAPYIEKTCKNKEPYPLKRFLV